MAYGRKWKPSKKAVAEYAAKMDEINEFVSKNGISASRSMDSYYFTLDGVEYRVSNHSVESSNANAKDEFGNIKRDLYHPEGREKDTVYIHAGKTRIIEIYNDLKAGYKLDGNGNRKDA